MMPGTFRVKPLNRITYLKARIAQTKRYLTKEHNHIEQEILMAKLNDLKKELLGLDPLEEFCLELPHAIECKVFDL